MSWRDQAPLPPLLLPRRAFVGGVLASLLASTARAAADLPPEHAALLLLRSLGYDQRLVSRVGRQLTILVCFRPDRTLSVRNGRALHRAFRRLTKHTLAGLPIRVLSHEYIDRDGLVSAMTKHDVGALCVAEGFEDYVPSITAVTRRAQAASLTLGVDNVRRGIAIGVSMEGLQPRLHINLAASRQEGMQFDARLLKVANVIT